MRHARWTEYRASRRSMRTLSAAEEYVSQNSRIVRDGDYETEATAIQVMNHYRRGSSSSPSSRSRSASSSLVRAGRPASSYFFLILLR